jgi:hypothetical protein
VDDIENYNKKTWLWKGCKHIKQGDFICLGPGAIPMPVSLPNAKCGPQVIGTPRPDNIDDIASLNPCPSKDECVRFILSFFPSFFVIVYLPPSLFCVEVSSLGFESRFRVDLLTDAFLDSV